MAQMHKTFILTCSECGHTEAGSHGRALMLKVRMLNHVTKNHPDLADRFREVIEAREKELAH